MPVQYYLLRPGPGQEVFTELGGHIRQHPLDKYPAFYQSNFIVNGLLKQWFCYSGPDLVHWTEQPSPLSVAAFAWAAADAWASQVIARNGKFYRYAAVEHGSVHRKAIGVVVSDSPSGPFVDARGADYQ